MSFYKWKVSMFTLHSPVVPSVNAARARSSPPTPERRTPSRKAGPALNIAHMVPYLKFPGYLKLFSAAGQPCLCEFLLYGSYAPSVPPPECMLLCVPDIYSEPLVHDCIYVTASSPCVREPERTARSYQGTLDRVSFFPRGAKEMSM